jgi:hypothetical protein
MFRMDSLEVTWHTWYPHDVRSERRALSAALEAMSSSFSSIISDFSVDRGLT